MRKAYFLIAIVFVFISLSNFSLAATNEYNKSLSYDWLYKHMDNVNWSKKVDEVSLSVLALSAEDYDVSAGVNKLIKMRSSDFSWSRNLEDTAWATFTLYQMGRSVENETNWLINKEELAQLNGEWLIQILAEDYGECNVYYGDNYANFIVNETTILSGCDVNNPWINIEDCVKHGVVSKYELFEIDCDHSSYEPSLLFNRGTEYFLLSSGDQLELQNACYRNHGACDCSTTGYVSWILKELKKKDKIHTNLFLEINCNSEIMENAFLYMLTEEDIYAEKLRQQQSYRKWDNTFTTAFVVMALKENANSKAAVSNATEWLKSHQRVDGSWEGSIKDTAMVLYALYGSGSNVHDEDIVCGDNDCDPGEAITCPQDCDNVNNCDDNGIVDEAVGEQCDASYYSNGSLKSGNDSNCLSNEKCVDCVCQRKQVVTGCDKDAGDECETSSNCNIGEICDTDTCTCIQGAEDECTSDDDCNIGETCDTVTNTCEEEQGCEFNSDCDIDEECVDGECQTIYDTEICDNEIDDDNDDYIDCEDSDCKDEDNCKKSSSLIWIIAILVILIIGALGYFMYTKYFKRKGGEKPSFDRYVQQRELQKPIQLSKSKKSVQPPMVRRPVNITPSRKDMKLEQDLDESLRKARELLRKKD